jgi:hypothetical protein
MIKSRRMRYAGHVARMGCKKNAYWILVGKPDGRDHEEYLNVGGKVKTNHREIGWDGMDWIHLDQDREGSCEHSNEPSGSIKYWEVLEQQSDWRLPKKGSAPFSQLVIKNIH